MYEKTIKNQICQISVNNCWRSIIYSKIVEGCNLQLGNHLIPIHIIDYHQDNILCMGLYYVPQKQMIL
jgi:hypothetical protein